MRRLKAIALDYGRARTGVAVSDPTGLIVRPLRTIERVDSTGGSAFLDRILAQEDPAVIVIGDPVLMSGSQGEQSRHAHEFADRLRQRVSIPIEMIDERLTSVEARRRLRESGGSATIDSAAACILLESWLAAR